METAIVKPLPKIPGLDLINKNYGPISNLPFISKLVKKCMLQQLLDHRKNHDLLQDFQSAYCEHCTTETSLIKLTNDILWSMERQQITAIVILDLSAAFDMVDHEILLQIQEQTLVWGEGSTLVSKLFKVMIIQDQCQWKVFKNNRSQIQHSTEQL